MRLIDADELKTNCDIMVGDITVGRRDYVMFHEIDSAPTVDAVEVVRCKDCKHRDVEDGFCEGRGWPMQLVPDDGFCDKGKRSEK